MLKMYSIRFNFIGVLISTLILFIACENLHEEKIIPKEQILQIDDIDNLNAEYENEESDDELDILYGKKMADKQAKIWDDAPSLVLVYSKRVTRPTSHTTTTHIPDKDGFSEITLNPSPKITVWHYIYKNKSETSILGVTVGSKGIIDAKSKIINQSILSKWPSIIVNRIVPPPIRNSSPLLALIDIGDKLSWASTEINNYSYFLPSVWEYFDANTGKIINSSNSPLNDRPQLVEAMGVTYIFRN